MRHLLLFVLLAHCVTFGCKAFAAPSPVDYTKAGDEAVKLLCDYIKIDTTVPPGNEKLGAEFLSGVLKKEGIDSQILETAPGRACIYARLKGSGKGDAIVLLNHIDVVPAEAKDWRYPPFGGEIHDGEVWGRGALDMKGEGILQLMAMILLKRSGATLDRDVIFIGTPDEEMGAEFGAKWFKLNKPELVKDAKYLINEGCAIDADAAGKAKFWGINVAEKSVLWLEVKASGMAGHASMPMADAATNRLVRALTKLNANPPAPAVSDQVAYFFKKIADTAESPKLREYYLDIKKAVADPEAMKVLMQDKMKACMLSSTISLTVLKAGYKTNVIPAEAVAQLDCRLLPGADHKEFIEQVKKIMDDPSLEVKVLEWEKAEKSDLSPLTDAIAEVAKEEDPTMPVVPVVVPWFTDSHWFRELGLKAYGFIPLEIDPQHLATMHGKDERVPITAIHNGLRRMHKILLKFCTAPYATKTAN